MGDEQADDAGGVDLAERELNGRIAHVTVSARNALGRAQVPVSATAQFVQYDGVETRAVRRSLDLWSPPAGLREGECLLRDEATMLDPRDWYTSRIDLLHAGALSVSSPLDGIELSPRPMPDLLPYLGGYTYGTDGRQPLYYEPELPLEVWSNGGEQVGGFDVVMELPPPILVAYVGGQAVGSAESIDIALDDDLLVLWDPAGSGEPIYLLLEEDGVDPGPRLTCVAYDDGGFLFTREALELLRPASGWSISGFPTSTSPRRWPSPSTRSYCIDVRRVAAGPVRPADRSRLSHRRADSRLARHPRRTLLAPQAT